jgi:DNA-binding LytR/AlgR family response regulator
LLINKQDKNKQVLVVEDNPVTYQLLCELLQCCHEHVTILWARQTAAASRLIRNYPVELIMVGRTADDRYRNAGMGLAWIAQIRSMEQYRFVPVIMVSIPPAEYETAFRKLHCYGILTRPFSKETAVPLLQDALRYRMPQKSSFFCIRQKQLIFPMSVSDIVYIEHMRRKLLIHTRMGEFQSVYQSCSKTAAQMAGDGFAVCARGIVVNLHYVSNLDRKNRAVVLKDGYGTLKLGRQYAEQIKDTLQQM